MNTIKWRYNNDPQFYRTLDGDVYITSIDWVVADDTYGTRLREWDGPRNDAATTTVTVMRPIPGTAPGFIGIGMPDHRLVKLDPSNAQNLVTTLAGWRTKRDTIAYHPFDTSVSTARLLADQKELVGSFPDGEFKQPWDLAIDEGTGLVYIADAGNHRIAIYDPATATVRTYAGKTGVSGNVDGNRLTARFNTPKSVEIIGRTLYVADSANKLIRAINLDTGAVTTAVGNGPNVPSIPDVDTVYANIAAYTWQKVPFDAAAMVYPGIIRQDSRGNLIVQEANPRLDRDNGGTGNARRIDFGSREVTQIYRTGAHWIEVDRRGLVGPVDHILSAGWVSTDHVLYSVSPDASTIIGITGSPTEDFGADVTNDELDDSLATEGNSVYPFRITIDDREPRWGISSNQRSGYSFYRPMRPTDTYAYDFELFSTGQAVHFAGTVYYFFRSDSRPSFGAISGNKGHHRLGNQPFFDQLSQMSDVALAQFIRDGMGGQVPRPELTGKDLWAYIYFIRLNSIQYKTSTINKDAIAANLDAAGFFGPNGRSDTRHPEIRAIRVFTENNKVRILAQTDEPAFCIPKFGETDYYGNTNIPMENAFSKDHDITINTMLSKNVIDTFHFQLRCRDEAGNQTWSRDKLMTGEDAPPPPKTNRAPSVSAGVDQKITLPATASLNGTVSDDDLPDPPKKVTTAWSKVSGPGTVTFGNASNEDTTASFSVDGVYVLRLTANDAALTASDDVQITVRKEGSPPENDPPVVSAGADLTLTLPETATLHGTVTDDGLPDPPKKVTTAWSKVSGPGTVTFGNASATDTTASLSVAGTYVLRLTGSDSDMSTFDDIQITVQAPIGPKGLVGFWKFEGDARDSSEYGNDGTLKGSATFATGKRGQALLLDGTTDTRVEVPDSDTLDMAKDQTIAAWINADVFGSDQRGVVSKKNTSNQRDDALQFTVLKTPEFRYGIYQKDMGVYGGRKASTTLSTGTWYHLVGVYRSDVPTFDLYVNGQLRNGAIEGTVPTKAATGNSPLWFGDENGALEFKGMIDDICIWDEAKSDADIARLYNGGSGLDCDQLNPPPPPPGDSTPPVISNIRSSVTVSSATIDWNTDENADSQVEYGTSVSYGNSTVLDATLVLDHTVVISGLAPSTTYHYRVKSKDAAGNLAVSGNQSFKTEDPPPMDICAQFKLEFFDPNNNISKVAVKIVHQATSQVLFAGEAASTVQGKVFFNQQEFLTAKAGEKYAIYVKPWGFFQRVLKNVDLHASLGGPCLSIGKTPFGDINENANKTYGDGKMDKEDLLAAIAHWKTRGNPILTELFGKNFKLRDLVRLIQNFVKRLGDEK